MVLVTTWMPYILFDMELSQMVRKKHKCEDFYKVTNRMAAPRTFKATEGRLTAVSDNCTSENSVETTPVKWTALHCR